MTTITAPARSSAHKTVTTRPKWGDWALRIVAGIVLLYLFLPIFVIVLFSFNKPAGKFNYSWQGFTLPNWAHPFKYPPLTDALVLSLEVAAISTAIALVLGTLVAIALVRQRWRGQKAVDTFLVLPLTAPEVVMGAALLTLFLDRTRTGRAMQATAQNPGVAEILGVDVRRMALYTFLINAALAALASVLISPIFA